MMIDFLKEVDTEKRSSKLKGEVSSNIPQYALHYTVSTCVCVCVCVYVNTGAGMRNLLYSLADTPVLLS